jgi:hypothetical protein
MKLKVKKLRKSFANAAPEIVLVGWAVVAAAMFAVRYVRLIVTD